MRLHFPDEFIFGTSTSAGQIETAYSHNWEGLKAMDGYEFNITTDHEKRYDEDIDIIASVAPGYRMSLMWSRLQRHPYADFDNATTEEYHQLLQALVSKGVSIMMVIDHWVYPVWFTRAGGWGGRNAVALWLDFAKKLVNEFGQYVSIWNTFNEPNLFITFSYITGEFPPHNRNWLKAMNGIQQMKEAHEKMYYHIKSAFPERMVGVSHNCAVFSADNVAGVLPAKFSKWWYQDYLSSFFTLTDFTGISYYARLTFDPLPVTNLYTPKKFIKSKKACDDIWEYYPMGLQEVIREFAQKYNKPIIITENGICTSDDTRRVQAIKDYMLIIRNMLDERIDIRGYYHWSTWDNFEWTLGPTFRFGLYGVDMKTMARKKKPSADVYRDLAFSRMIDI